ncbi:MAG: thioredoxin TrxA [Arsenophonus sp. NEOnobi-MAG3]
MNDKVIHLSDENFNTTILEAVKPILVDFWAKWCAPCKMIAPILDEIAYECAAKLIIGKLNVEDNPVTAAKYSIRSIPTLVLFKGGELLNKQVGLLSKTQLKEFLDKNIKFS